MPKAQRKEQEKMPESILDQLAAKLRAPMAETNQIILDQLQSDVPLIPELARYLIAAGGKRIRPLLTLASASLCNHVNRETYLLAAAVEFIHTATLLHDDVVDESFERRGKPSANTVFGNQASVLVGDFLFARAFELMVESGSMPVLGLLSRAAAEIAEGEVMQLKALNNLTLGQDHYLAIIRAKTAALFGAATAVGPMLAKTEKAQQKAMQDYGLNLGFVFQIVDDVLDYTASTAQLGKDSGNDFREGKVTLPVLLAYRQATSDEASFWQRVMTQPQDQAPEDFNQAQAILQRHAIPAQCLSLAEKYAKAAQKALDVMPDTLWRNDLINVVDFCLERQS